MLNPRCRISKVVLKDTGKEIPVLAAARYRTSPEVVMWLREFWDILAVEDVWSVGVVAETSEGTLSNFIVTPKAQFTTLMSSTDVLKTKLINAYLCD